MIYLLLVDRFANGDPTNDGVVDSADPAAFHGGDLAGVIDHLDHLQQLGVERLWLTPLSRMRTEKFHGYGAFHGYWVEELGVVEPRFGDEAAVRALSDALHQRGIDLYLDMVYNHVAPDGELLAEHPEWFHQRGSIHAWDDPVEVVEGRVHGLPDLAQEREEVYEHLLAASRRWIDLAHPDGLRIDAVRHLPPTFLARLKGDLPGLPFLGEVFDGNPRVVADVVRQSGLDAVFDFPLYYAMIDVFCRGAPPGALGAVFAQDAAYPAGTELVTFLDNHDLPRIATACHGREAVAEALRFQFAARGTPAVTWGVEAELEGAGEPENRADMSFVPTPTGALLRELAAVRRQSAALHDGGTRDLALDDELYAFVRTGADPRLVVVNRGAAERVVAGVRAPAGEVTLAPFQGRLPRDGPVRVGFRLGGASTPAEVRLVGSADALGAWDPTRGVPLPATVSLPRAVVAYKLVRVRTDGGFEWEDGPNRYLLPARGSAVVLASPWG